MKKTFRIAALLLALATGGVVTSCDNDTVMSLLNILLQALAGNPQTYTSDKCTAAYIYFDAEGNPIIAGDKQEGTTFRQVSSIANVSMTNTVTVTLPNQLALCDTVKMEGVTIYKLPLENASDVVKFDLGEASTIDGKLTIGTKEYAAYNLYIEKGTLSQDRLECMFDIYFGSDDDCHVIKYVFSGHNTTPVENQQ